MSFIHFHIHSRSSNVFHVTSSSNGLLQLQRELGPRVESTTRGPSRQSGDRSLAPDNAGDMIGTSYWGIYWPMISMRCSIIITYYYWVLYIILETYIHGYIYIYVYIQQSTGSYSQTRGENGKELQPPVPSLPGRMTNHAGDAAQSPIQARKKSATKLVVQFFHVSFEMYLMIGGLDCKRIAVAAAALFAFELCS